jgi:hypothetical protein
MGMCKGTFIYRNEIAAHGHKRDAIACGFSVVLGRVGRDWVVTVN